MNHLQLLDRFNEIWLVDFEYIAPDGELPKVVCLVAMEYRSGKKIRLWRNDLDKCQAPPYAIDKNSLFIAYYASSEMNCHLSLGWQFPVNLIDLFVEFKNIKNGLELPYNYNLKKKPGNSLVDALLYYGLNTIGSENKEAMRNLVMGGSWSKEEEETILNYCESDVMALHQLLPKIIPGVNIGQALLRGEFMKASACIENTGIPVDHETYQRITKNWEEIKGRLIQEFNKEYKLYVNGSFKRENFKKWLSKNNIRWPTLESGELDLKDETFREMARIHKEVSPIREIRHILGKMRMINLAIGLDKRNRCMLSAFKSITGRNQPSTTKSIFGPAVWLRSLVKPTLDNALAYIDWSQQEFGIAAALSRDENMMNAYRTGDPYLEFAKQAGSVPTDATKLSHSKERELFKQCALGVLYGMGARTLSERVGDISTANHLIKLHHQTFPDFWLWLDCVSDFANMHCYLETVFGWKLNVSSGTKQTTIRNFLMQANGSEMLRLACCLAIRNEIHICMPVHDAILIQAPTINIDTSIKITQQAMAQASKEILSGFELSTDVKIIKYPDRYVDPRGVETWDSIINIIHEISGAIK